MKPKYIKRLFIGENQSYFLFGPRGTGKSTWFKRNLKEYLLIDLLEPDVFRKYSAHPERLHQLIEANPDKRIIIIDEVQKIPDLLAVVHSLIEKKRNLCFILTGSSSRKIKRSGVDLLAGRAIIKNMHPFLAFEVKSFFRLDSVLKTGLLPVIFFAPNQDKALQAYITLYIKEEIQMEGLIRNLGNFSRFLETISFSHGSVLNISNISRECEIERKTVESYIHILYDLLLAYSIPVFHKRAKRILVKHSKFYFFDTGVYRALRPSGPLDRNTDIEGVALEGLIAQHLRAWIDYSGQNLKLYYWRTKSGSEVDFIIYGNSGFWAIEVKNKDKINAMDIKHLKAFKDDYPEAKAIFIYRGNERLKINNILCIPCEEFLLNLRPMGSDLRTSIFQTRNPKV